jgi:hypothetical protein
MLPANPPTPDETPPSSWSVRARLVASVLIALHLAAVVAAPLAGPPPSSELERAFGSLFEWYQQAAFINHGYRFFAPDPGPGQVVRVEYDLPDGTSRSETFPDRAIWPRLYYHRHLILAAYLADVTRVPDDRRPLDEELTAMKAAAARLRAADRLAAAADIEAEIVLRQRVYEMAILRKRALLRGLADHLLRESGARRVRFFAGERAIPAPWQVHAGVPLNDPQFYEERALGQYEPQVGGTPVGAAAP